MKTYFKQEIGKIGEEIATKYLESQGYQIVEKNFFCKQGEIDIISYNPKAKEYVFIEVKTRTNFHYGRPSEAVNEPKQKHIWNATKYYIYSHHLENKYIRFDVIEVYKKQNRFYINHLKQIM